MDVPELDKRDLNFLVQKMKKMVPYYTPEWRFSPEDPDPGTGLFLLFADMFLENIKRFNQVPYRNFIAFLNLLDVSLLPAKPARTYLTFRLSRGAAQPVYIPSGTRVSGTNGEEEIVFETEQPLLVTPALPLLGYCTDGGGDRINELPQILFNRSEEPAEEDENLPYELFNFSRYDNLQEHCIYLGHDYLLDVRETARCEIELINTLRRYREAPICEKLADPDNVEWLYSVEDGWQPFNEVMARGNRLVLIKEKTGEIGEKEIEEIKSRWIKCRVKTGKLANLLPDKLELDGLLLKTEYEDSSGEGGLSPELFFFNDIQLEEDGFYPFGEQLLQFSTFYLASREAFTKKYGQITIDFKCKLVRHQVQAGAEEVIEWKLIMKEKDFRKEVIPEIRLLQVLWEYWNGEGWVRLFPDEKYENIFSVNEEHKSITFECPADLAESTVNAQSNYWIRARILKLDSIYSLNSVYLSPWMEKVKISYSYGERRFPPQQCITFNNLEYLNRTADLYRPGKPFKPLYGLEPSFPALYLGFEAPPFKGPLGFFLSLEPYRQNTGEIPYMEWEALGRHRGAVSWIDLKVMDETHSLTKSGAVKFTGPSELTRTFLFGKNLYWLRLVNPDSRLKKGKQGDDFPLLKGIFMNTVAAVQQESVAEEIPERIPDTVPPVFTLSRCPVLSADVWVDETERLSEEELSVLQEDNKNSLKVIRTDAGAIQKIWVRWEEVKSFAASAAGDRHFVLDHATGTLSFGDGVKGSIPPLAGMEKIKVNYSTGGGEKGNIAPWQIASLQNSIAFVERVFNPEPAGGGAEREALAQALWRGPQVLKHQGRAVTAEDFEWLVRDVSPEIARVKCLPNYNERMERQTGVVTIALFPAGGAAGFSFFPELRGQVEACLREKAANILALPGKIRVIEAAMLEISIMAVLSVSLSEQVYPVEMEAVKRLTSFLDPITGNFDGKGWGIGQYVHISVLYALLKSIGGVNHVEKISMTVHKVEGRKRTEISPGIFAAVPHGVIVSGKHTVFVEVM